MDMAATRANCVHVFRLGQNDRSHGHAFVTFKCFSTNCARDWLKNGCDFLLLVFFLLLPFLLIETMTHFCLRSPLRERFLFSFVVDRPPLKLRNWPDVTQDGQPGLLCCFCSLHFYTDTTFEKAEFSFFCLICFQMLLWYYFIVS